MTPRKTTAATKKAASTKAPAARPIKPLPAPPSTEGRIAQLEESVAQLRAEVTQIGQIIQQAIVAQMQQAIANDPAAQQVLLAHFQAQTNGAP